MRTPLLYACYFNRTQIVQLLLEANANPNLIDKNDNHSTCMHYAVSKGNIKVIKLLSKHGFNFKLLNNKQCDTMFLKLCHKRLC